MAKLPAIRTEGASPFARRSRMPAGSFDELLARFGYRLIFVAERFPQACRSSQGFANGLFADGSLRG